MKATLRKGVRRGAVFCHCWLRICGRGSKNIKQTQLEIFIKKLIGNRNTGYSEGVELQARNT